ncbi:cysteine synthase [Rhodococcus sp. 1163]|uniref:PLP-dependent cysteine synthase family protein n=1 Tax=unclassified Rhodococcus (in: high G+C Gram-positive bacteria) TaxID=192944 RepID=UPI000A0243C4|nr:PLP-dependent cysteine synthase family protein [Rhodococcus sp. 1163]ORI17860.1 cysteine synthase [Rhodococcus sp. 1163]
MTRIVDHSASREWVDNAVRLIDADAQRSADTHLLRYPLPAAWNVQLYLKDESTHITGSLKHRLARSLFLYSICNGWVTENTTVVEASSGSTAVSEAYFARLLGLRFVAVMPRSTSPAKIALIETHGGKCHFVDDPAAMYTEAHRLTAEPDTHYMDQFTHAERATDWRGNNNIAESIFDQLTREESPIPTWVVVGAGTGGTSATIGRYIRYRRHATRLAVVDPENSAFIGGYESGSADYETDKPSRIEGIGRTRIEPSFVGQVIDRMIAVPDAASVAATRHTSTVLGKRVGGSTGTNMWGAFGLISDMISAGNHGSVVTVLCDGGERYADTYFDDSWVAEQGMDLTGPTSVLENFLKTGEFAP